MHNLQTQNKIKGDYQYYYMPIGIRVEIKINACVNSVRATPL